MIIQTAFGQAELGERELVIRTRRGDRVLPFDTIARVEYVEAKSWLSSGHLRPILVGDPTRSRFTNLDPNAMVPDTSTKAKRELAQEFLRRLLECVAAAEPKRPHPRLEELASDPAAAVRPSAPDRQESASQVRDPRVPVQGAGLSEGVVQPVPVLTGRDAARTAAEAKRDEQAQAKAAARAAFEQDVRRQLDAARRHAGSGDVRREWGALHSALGIGRRFGGRKAEAWVQAEIDGLRAAGLVFIGASRLGVVEGESRLDAMSRKDSIGSLFAGKPEPIEIFSDRVIQSASCWPIDADTTASVFTDGERQRVSNNVFNSKRQNTDDRRHAEFHVGGGGWSMKVAVAPDRLDVPRQMAAQVEIAAQRRRSERPVPVVPHSSIQAGPAAAAQLTSVGPSVVEQLERLQALRQTGAIDDAEFAVLKSSILSGV